jgi:hypothetical protein
LTLVTSTLYPAPVSEIDTLEWSDRWHWWSEEVVEIAPPDGSATEVIVPRSFRPPPNPRPDPAGLDVPYDRWVLAYHPPDSARGVYRPVWRCGVEDQRGNRWLALIDAQTSRVLLLQPATVHHPLTAEVFVSSQHAKAKIKSNETLPVETGATVAQDPHVRFVRGDDSRFVDPGDSNFDPASESRLLSANVFYHVRKIQDELAGHVKLALVNKLPTDARPNPFEAISVLLSKQKGDASFSPTEHMITLFAGVEGGSFPISEPGFDCEVIYHEFAHAVIRYVNGQPFTSSALLQARSLDEGIAFYLACAFAESQLWADAAYEEWCEFHDLATMPALVSEVDQMDYPSDMEHARGLWWAGLFWALRTAVGVQECYRLLLQAWEASTSVRNPQDFAQALIDHAPGREAEVRSVLASHGINVA